ncbi:MAG TPA: hypothetical protein VF541_05455 [Longimicrobium sp.]|jgi:hypothetical protein
MAGDPADRAAGGTGEAAGRRERHARDVNALLDRTRAVIEQTRRVVEQTKSSLQRLAGRGGDPGGGKQE